MPLAERKIDYCRGQLGRLALQEFNILDRMRFLSNAITVAQLATMMDQSYDCVARKVYSMGVLGVLDRFPADEMGKEMLIQISAVGWEEYQLADQLMLDDLMRARCLQWNRHVSLQQRNDRRRLRLMGMTDGLAS